MSRILIYLILITDLTAALYAYDAGSYVCAIIFLAFAAVMLFMLEVAE